MRRICVVLSGAVAFMGFGSAWSAAPRLLQGAQIYTPDTGVCIAPTDHLTIHLRRLILPKTSKWLGLVEDRSAAFYVNTTLAGSSNADNKKVSLSTVNKEGMSDYSTGLVSFPVEQSIISDFPLTNGTSRFTEVAFEFSVVKAKGKSDAAQVLLGAVSATKNLTLPANPLGGALDIASSYINAFVDPLVEAASSNGEAQSLVRFALSIHNANCAVDDARTGTRAVVFATDNLASAGAVDINKSYCWKVETSPQWMLKVANQTPGGDCTGVNSFAPVTNAYVMFYVSAASQGRATPPPLGAQVTQFQAARARLGFSAPLKRTIAKAFKTNAAQADMITQAILSDTSSAEIGDQVGIASRDIDVYRDAVKRCEAVGMPPRSCFK